MRGKVPGTRLHLTPSFLDFLKDESGVERLAQAAVKDTIAIVEGENKTLSQLVIVLVDMKVVKQLIAIQLREATHNELEIFADVLKLPVNLELTSIDAIVFPGRGIFFVIHWTGLAPWCDPGRVPCL